MHLRLLLMLSAFSSSLFAQTFTLYVGTYTGSGSKGIYAYRFNALIGKATFLNARDSVTNPSFLAISPNKKFLFAVNETDGKNPGKVNSYAINPTTGKLTFLNQQETGGDNPCYVAVHKSNNWLAVANYSGGSASVLKINANGSLQPYAQLMQDSGKGTNPARQEKAHVHSTVFSPDNAFLFTPDLGLDKVMAYRFNQFSARPLTKASPSMVTTEDGSGPRHLTFHPNNRFAYLIEEMAGVVSAYKYNNGRLILIQRIATHPSTYKGNPGSADIHVSPDGKFLYASNRGDENNISIFKIDPRTGRLQAKGYQSVLGKTPRNFVIDPTGNYLLAANQGTNNVVIFKRNKTTGALTATGNELQIPMPVCLKWL
ncbi:MAG: lactonase family protein [Chitinophagaceae bacterium]|nr:lactonase family protein [Chitinophagaceae bacterium]